MPVPEPKFPDHFALKIAGYNVSMHVTYPREKSEDTPISQVEISLTPEGKGTKRTSVKNQTFADTRALRNLIETRLSHEGFSFVTPMLDVIGKSGIVQFQPDPNADHKHLPANPVREIVETLQDLYVKDLQQDLRAQRMPTLEQLARESQKNLKPPPRERKLDPTDMRIASHNPFSLESLQGVINHTLNQSDLAVGNDEKPAYCKNPEKDIPRITNFIMKQVYRDGNCLDKQTRQPIRPPLLTHVELRKSVRTGLDVALIALNMNDFPKESRDKIMDHFMRQQYALMREDRGLNR